MQAEPLAIRFGLVTQSWGSEKLAAFESLTAWMVEHAAVALERRDARSYEALAASVRDGSVDLAWLPPAVYARIAEGTIELGSIVREGQASYLSALVVETSSPYRALSDVRALRAGWVDPWSAAGFVLPRIALAKRGIAPSSAFRTERFLGSHKAVLAALASGECDVGAVYARRGATGALEGAWADGDGAEVRVLETFGPIPPDMLAVRRNLDPEAFLRVRDALRAACAAPEARPWLDAVFGGSVLREGTDPGHEALRLELDLATAHGLFD